MATTIDTLATEASSAYADAKQLADNALAATDTALNEAAAAVSGLHVDWSIAGYNPDDVTIDSSRLTKPLMPTTDYSSDVREAFDYAFGQLNNDIQPQIQNYLDTFFPDISEAIRSTSDDWIVETITSGRFVPIEVENALYDRARDREIQEALRNEQSVREASAASGFSMPNGVLNYTLSANQQETSKRLTTINREIALKAFDIANENTKFAIQQAVALRTGFVAALGDFIKIAMVQPNQAVDYAKTILAAKSSLYENAVSLYSAKINEEKLRSSVGLENQNVQARYWDLFVKGRSSMMDSEIDIAKVQANTAIQAADTLAKVAAGALATRNTMVSLSAAP